MEYADVGRAVGGVGVGGLDQPRGGDEPTEKNQLKPWQVQSWCIPPKENASFVAKMEDVLEVYSRPYDPMYPQVCLDEKRKEMHATPKGELALEVGKPQREDYEYERNGTASILLWNEPLTGKCGLSVEETADSLTFAAVIKAIVDVHFAHAKRIVLVTDNASFHSAAALYKTFAPEEAFRLMQKIEWHYTPEHGSWLNMAEVELSVLHRQCLDRRIANIETLKSETNAWAIRRNQQKVTIHWRFTTADARIKLAHLYPKRNADN
jgi:transposase